MVCAIAESEVDDPISSYLRYSSYTARFEELAHASDEGRRGRGCCAGVMGNVCAKARVDNKLAFAVRFGDFEKKYTLLSRISWLVEVLLVWLCYYGENVRTEDRS